MSAKASHSFSAHLALRLFGVGALVSLASAFSVYQWERGRDLEQAVATVRHFAQFIGNETIEINLEGGNMVYVAGALGRLAAIRPVRFAYVLDPGGQTVASSPGSDEAAAGGERLALIDIPLFRHSTNEPGGTLRVAVSVSEAERNARSDALRVALVLFGLELLLGLPMTFLLSRRLSRPIRRMRETLEQSAAQAGANEALIRILRDDSGFESIHEFELLRRRMLELHQAIEAQHESLQKAHASAALGELASQIAHDIRSPLLALNAAIDGPASSEPARKLVRDAIQSIQQIAQGLLAKNREVTLGAGPTAPASTRATPAPECLLLVLDRALEQKRAQLRDRAGLELLFESGEESYAVFSPVVPIELERVVSNLVNNAAEAIDGAGRIVVRLSLDGARARVTVSDTGRGIPPELVSRLGSRGLSVGKAGGSGLGLHHARSTLESWGGALLIESTPGAGTAVTLELPVAEPPRWFASRVRLPQGASVVIADDEEAVHALWDRRLDGLGLASAGRFHARTPDEVLAWFRSNVGTEAVFLCDHEFRGHATRGLELLERLGVAATSYLVTGHADDGALRARCEKLGVRLVPKSLLERVPLEG